MKTLRARTPSIARLAVTVCLVGYSVLCSPNAANAEVRLASVFNDHMVLQQQQPIRIWGWAKPGEVVKVTLGANAGDATANQSGRWQVELPALSANKSPQSILIQGKNAIEIKDVLVGEVWLCSGQSNMEWTVGSSTNAAAEIAAAQYPMIRHIKVPRVPSTMPLNDFDSGWQVCSPETVAGFTACGYFMARKLSQDLDVPVGLINSSWGGTRVEPWTPPVGFQRVNALQDIYQSVIGRTPGTPEYRNRLQAHIAATESWVASAKAAIAKTDSSEGSGTVLDASPAFPAELAAFTSHQDPTMLYNGMIHALVGFPIRGAIWYQGESNHAEGTLYTEKKKALINGWRELWGQGDFPFYYVQIAPFQYGNEDPTILPKFWEAQAAVQQLPNTGMVVINDIATLNDIHPPNKQDVGLRLALLALKNDYGQTDVVAHSPELSNLEVLDGRLKLTFKNTGGGLMTRDQQRPTLFEVIGPGSDGFQPAKATIEGDSVILTAANVEKPVAFRFAWNKLAEPNLTGKTGLPVGACRGGDVPDFLSSIPIVKEYQLVYDLNLEKLAHDIVYDVDKSGEVKGFDRIGYLLELTSADGKSQNVFVSMDAFTEDVNKIGIPTIASQASYQQSVNSMDVFCDVAGLPNGKSMTSGNIEFWPNNYSAVNAAKVSGASDSLYDHGDQMFAPVDGYGSMQIHDHASGQTLFAINHWNQGSGADVGIGNSTGQSRDWTFTGNAASYSSKRLRVFVRPK